MARRLGVVDEPGAAAAEPAADAAARRDRALPRHPRAGARVPASATWRGILLGAAVATTVGVVDDFRGLPGGRSSAASARAAAIRSRSAIWIDRFTFPFVGIHELPAWVGVPATILWIVALMNMVNFLDGLDGLAAGVCGIAGATFAVIALSLGKPKAAILSAIVAGACFGFLRHNFYPARIFMGDSGALLLGFVLATLAVQGLLKTAATVALFFPLLVLAVPILDTSFVVARRLKHGEKLYVADQAHLHHRFLRRGFSQRRAALTMYAWCGTLAGAALATRFIPFREHGEWHLWPTLARGAIGLVAVAVLALRRLPARDREARGGRAAPAGLDRTASELPAWSGNGCRGGTSAISRACCRTAPRRLRAGVGGSRRRARRFFTSREPGHLAGDAVGSDRSFVRRFSRRQQSGATGSALGARYVAAALRGVGCGSSIASPKYTLPFPMRSGVVFLVERSIGRARSPRRSATTDVASIDARAVAAAPPRRVRPRPVTFRIRTHRLPRVLEGRDAHGLAFPKEWRPASWRRTRSRVVMRPEPRTSVTTGWSSGSRRSTRTSCATSSSTRGRWPCVEAAWRRSTAAAARSAPRKLVTCYEACSGVRKAASTSLKPGARGRLWPPPGRTARSAPSQLALERVADGVEGRVVRARDDELGERRPPERRHRDLEPRTAGARPSPRGRPARGLGESRPDRRGPDGRARNPRTYSSGVGPAEERSTSASYASTTGCPAPGRTPAAR